MCISVVLYNTEKKGLGCQVDTVNHFHWGGGMDNMLFLVET